MQNLTRSALTPIIAALLVLVGVFLLAQSCNIGAPPATPVETCQVKAGEKTQCRFNNVGVTVEVPAQTRNRPLDLKASKPQTTPTPDPKKNLNFTVIRAVIDLEVKSNNEPVTEFDPPLTLIMQYTDEDARAAKGDPRNLKVFLFDGARWSNLVPDRVDTAAKTVTVLLKSLLGDKDPIGYDF